MTPACTQLLQVCEFDALLSILERSPAPAGLPRAPSAPHPNPAQHWRRVGAGKGVPSGACRIASAGSNPHRVNLAGDPGYHPRQSRMTSASSDSLALHVCRGGDLSADPDPHPNPRQCRMVSAASDSLVMQPRWAQPVGAQPAYGGATVSAYSGAEDEADAELGLPFNAKLGGWLAGDGWDVLSSGEAAQARRACSHAAYERSHTEASPSLGATQGARSHRQVVGSQSEALQAGRDSKLT